jgi:cytochrome P450
MNEHMVTMDPPMHTGRALLMRLITPRRLKDNEAALRRSAARRVRRRRPLPASSAYAQPLRCSSW